MSGNLVLSTWC